LASLAADLVADVIPPPEAAALAFVPPDEERRLKRGFHPSERLALALGERWELPVVAILARTGASRRQRGLPLIERRRNVRGAFHPVRSAPRRLVLVDDVYTSGATAAAASSALRKAGARRVEVVTFARAVR
jgi:predicted amidophosphoribosyltransferase